MTAELKPDNTDKTSNLGIAVSLISSGMGWGTQNQGDEGRVSEKLKPCPRCGAPAERRIGDTGPTNAYRKWVECTACTCSTNVYLTEDADDRPADDEWNALPRALVWTMEPPAFGEWNWWRLGPNDENRPICRYVYTDGTIDNTMIGSINWQDIGGQWAGPIPAPQEQAS